MSSQYNELLSLKKQTHNPSHIPQRSRMWVAAALTSAGLSWLAFAVL